MDQDITGSGLGASRELDVRVPGLAWPHFGKGGRKEDRV